MIHRNSILYLNSLKTSLSRRNTCHYYSSAETFCRTLSESKFPMSIYLFSNQSYTVVFFFFLGNSKSYSSIIYRRLRIFLTYLHSTFLFFFSLKNITITPQRKHFGGLISSEVTQPKKVIHLFPGIGKREMQLFLICKTFSSISSLSAIVIYIEFSI